MLLNNYYITTSSADRLFDVLYWPVLDILIWGFMTYFISGISEVNILSFVLGGLLLWVFIWRSSQDFVIYVLENFWSRNIYHLYATPLRDSEMIVSLGILGISRSFIAFLLMNLISFALYQFNIFSFNLLHAAAFIGILMIFAWGIGLLITSFIFRFGTRMQILAWSTIWIIQPFSCIFYPLSALPTWAAKIAIVLPTTHVFEGLRASLAGQPLSTGSLLYALGFSIVFLIFSSWVIVRAIKVARSKGSFAKPE